MPQVHEITTYTIDELSEDAKEKARDWYREGGIFEEWHEGVYEDAKTIGELMGIDIDQIYFSGFSSQGDGACFTGDYRYKKGSLKAVKEYAPVDSDLHAIALELYKVQRRERYNVSAQVAHRGHYYHELCTAIDIDAPEIVSEDVFNNIEEDITKALRSFMRWIYARLGSEYDYLMSDESIDENIKANEYEFNLDGSIY